MRIRVFFLLLFAPCLYGAPPVETVVVFPFENLSGRLELDWVSESFAEVIESRLSSAKPYVLSRDERLAGFGLLGLPSRSRLTLASIFKVSQVVGADWAVTGAFNWSEDRISVRLQLVDMKVPRLRAILQEEGKFHGLLNLQSRLAWSLLRNLDPNFGMEKEDFVRSFPQVRLDAFESLIYGLLASEWDAQIRYFTKAFQLDPHERRSAFELGRLYLEDKKYAPSLEWLEKINPENQLYLEATFLKAINHYRLHDFKKAEGIFRQLTESLHSPEVHNNMGLLEVRKGNHSEAITHLVAAYQLDQNNADLNFNLALMFWKAGKFDQASRYIQECLLLRGDDSEAQFLQGQIVAKEVAAGKTRAKTLGLEREVRSFADDPLSTEPNLEFRILVEYNARPFRRPSKGAFPSHAFFMEKFPWEIWPAIESSSGLFYGHA